MSGAAVAGVGPRRCFLALLPDAAGRAALLQSRAVTERAIAGATRSVRWTPSAALHLTLRFLGPTDPTQVDYFKRVLPALARPVPAIAARRCGIWPNRARPRMLVLELGDWPVLAELAAECEAHARAAGFPPEQRAFRAHVTLARLRPGCVFGIVPNPHAVIEFASIALMESRLGGAEAAYLPLVRATLPRA